MVFRLYSRLRYESFMEYSVSEITRVPLTDLCLHARLLLPDVGRIGQFFCCLPSPPPTMAVNDAIATLVAIGALDVEHKVKDLDRFYYHIRVVRSYCMQPNRTVI